MSGKSLYITIFEPTPDFPYILWDWLIVWASNSQETHIALNTSDNVGIDASLNGVFEQRLPNHKYAHTYEIPNLTPYQVYGAIQWARDRSGQEYSILGAIAAGLMRKVGIASIADRIDKRWICSEFVAGALRYGAGIDIYPNVALRNILPVDIRRWLNKNGIYHGNREAVNS